MKKIISLLLALALVLSLAACGAKQEAPAATVAPTVEAPAETAAPETEAPTASSAWPKTIVDVMGNEITLEAPATRLVGTHNPTMNMAVILGGGGKYIAGFPDLPGQDHRCSNCRFADDPMHKLALPRQKGFLRLGFRLLPPLLSGCIDRCFHVVHQLFSSLK